MPRRFIKFLIFYHAVYILLTYISFIFAALYNIIITNIVYLYTVLIGPSCEIKWVNNLHFCLRNVISKALNNSRGTADGVGMCTRRNVPSVTWPFPRTCCKQPLMIQCPQKRKRSVTSRSFWEQSWNALLVPGRLCLSAHTIWLSDPRAFPFPPSYTSPNCDRINLWYL